eukprot:5158734-Pleurochrysis_carterae.AAC.1
MEDGRFDDTQCIYGLFDDTPHSSASSLPVAVFASSPPRFPPVPPPCLSPRTPCPLCFTSSAYSAPAFPHAHACFVTPPTRRACAASLVSSSIGRPLRLLRRA